MEPGGEPQAPPLFIRAGERTIAGSIMAAGNFSSALSQVLRFKVYAVTLGIAGTGVIGLVTAAQTLALSTSPLFSGVALLTVLSRARLVDGSARDSAVGASRLLAVVLSSLGSVIVLVVALVASPAVHVNDIAGLVLLGLVGTPFAALYLVETTCLQESARFGRLALANAIGAVVAVMITWSLTVAAGAAGAALSVSLAAVALWSSMTIAQQRGLRLPQLRFDPRIWAELWRPGVGALIASLVASLGSAGMRYVAIATLGPQGAGAVHTLLLVSMQVVFFLSASLGAFALPRITRLSAQNDRAGVRDEIHAILSRGVPMMGVLLLIMAAFAQPLTTLVASEDFGPVALLLPLQLVGDIFRVHYWLAGAYILPMGFRRAFVVVEVLWQSMFAVTVLATEPGLGLLAFPLGSIAASVAGAGFVTLHARENLGLSLSVSVVPLALTVVGLLSALVTPLGPILTAAGLLAWALVSLLIAKRATSSG